MNTKLLHGANFPSSQSKNIFTFPGILLKHPQLNHSWVTTCQVPANYCTPCSHHNALLYFIKMTAILDQSAYWIIPYTFQYDSQKSFLQGSGSLIPTNVKGNLSWLPKCSYLSTVYPRLSTMKLSPKWLQQCWDRLHLRAMCPAICLRSAQACCHSLQLEWTGPVNHCWTCAAVGLWLPLLAGPAGAKCRNNQNSHQDYKHSVYPLSASLSRVLSQLSSDCLSLTQLCLWICLSSSKCFTWPNNFDVWLMTGAESQITTYKATMSYPASQNNWNCNNCTDWFPAMLAHQINEM